MCNNYHLLTITYSWDMHGGEPKQFSEFECLFLHCLLGGVWLKLYTCYYGFKPMVAVCAWVCVWSTPFLRQVTMEKEGGWLQCGTILHCVYPSFKHIQAVTSLFYLFVYYSTFYTGCSTKPFDRVVNERVRKSAVSTFPATPSMYKWFPWYKNEFWFFINNSF